MGEIRHQHIQVPLAATYQSISDLTQHINEWNEAWPQHLEIYMYGLLFATII